MQVSFLVQDRHTAEYPYCKNVMCWCHINSEYHDVVTSPHLRGGVSRSVFEEALLFLSGDTPHGLAAHRLLAPTGAVTHHPQMAPLALGAVAPSEP